MQSLFGALHVACIQLCVYLTLHAPHIPCTSPRAHPCLCTTPSLLVHNPLAVQPRLTCPPPPLPPVFGAQHYAQRLLQGTPPPPLPQLEFQFLDAPLKCGYQRLRKALLWNDSKLQAAMSELLVCTGVVQRCNSIAVCSLFLFFFVAVVVRDDMVSFL